MFIIFSCSVFLILAANMGLQFLSPCLSATMLYLWTRRNPNTEINIMEFITFRAQFLPWLLITLVVVFGFDVQDDLVGAAVGHMYYFLMDVVPKIPETNKLSVLSAPSFLNRICQWLRIHEAGGNWESDFIG